MLHLAQQWLVVLFQAWRHWGQMLRILLPFQLTVAPIIAVFESTPSNMRSFGCDETPVMQQPSGGDLLEQDEDGHL